MPLRSLWLPKPNGEGPYWGESRGSFVRSELSVIYSPPLTPLAVKTVCKSELRGSSRMCLSVSGRCVTSGCSVSGAHCPLKDLQSHYAEHDMAGGHSERRDQFPAQKINNGAKIQ